MTKNNEELINYLQGGFYDIINIKEYPRHIQFKIYSPNDKWCIVNVFNKNDYKIIAQTIMRKFKHKHEINV